MNENRIQELDKPNLEATTHYKKPSLEHGGILFSIFTIIFIVSGMLQQKYLPNAFTSRGLIANEVFIVGLPPILFLIYLKYNLKYNLRLNRLSFKNSILVVSIMVSSLPIVLVINAIWYFVTKLILGQSLPDQLPVPENINQLLISYVAIGASAGICEELLFRGFILRSLEHLGIKKALLISALLFSIIHLEIEKIPGILFLGILIGYIVYKTNSIYAGMLAHFVNNSMAVTILFLYQKSGILEQAKNRSAPSLPGTQAEIIAGIIMGILGIGIILVIASFIFWAFFAKFKKTNNGKSEIIETTHKFIPKKALLYYIPGIATILYIMTRQAIKLFDPAQSYLVKLINYLGQ